MTETLHCPNCGMGFTLREDYLEHMRCYLPGARPYQNLRRAETEEGGVVYTDDEPIHE